MSHVSHLTQATQTWFDREGGYEEYCAVLQCAAVRCSVLQCAAVDEKGGYGVATISRLLKITGLFCRI